MTSTSRRPLIAGNWKLYKTVSQSVAFVRTLRNTLSGPLDVEVVVAPVFTALSAVAQALEGGRIALGAQDVHFENEGAFTGEVSAPLLKDVGCKYCIIGHSERRQLFGETDDAVQKKLRALFSQGITPVLCVGETLDQRSANRTLEVVLGQLEVAVRGLDPGLAPGLVIAYEPVWAIGTGRTASPADAQEVHGAIRDWLARNLNRATADAIRVLYGGSVKPDNAAGLLGQTDIDGALVGGASLVAESFVAIVQSASL